MFYPPGAPHLLVFGRFVRSCKISIVARMGNRSLVCLVEQTLNARPISPASEDPEDPEALTLNHFIMGRAIVSISYVPKVYFYINQRKM